jgi:hypothetical protein
LCLSARFIIHNLQQTKTKHHFCSTYFQCFFGNIVYFRFEGWGEVCVCISDQELVLWLKERTQFTEAYYCNFPASWAHCVASGKYIFQENQLAVLIPRKLTPAMASACRESKYFWTGSKRKMYYVFLFFAEHQRCVDVHFHLHSHEHQFLVTLRVLDFILLGGFWIIFWDTW